MLRRDAKTATSQTSLTVSGNDVEYSMRPQRLLVSVFGAFLRELGGWVSYHALVMLMAELDVDAKATRASAARLIRRGLVESHSPGDTLGLRLTDQAVEILNAADRRIFRPVEMPDDGKWLLVIFSIPESRRSERHLMRSRLEWLGFGRVSGAVWIAPAHVESETTDMLSILRLTEYVTLFKTDTPMVPDIGESIRSWWNLDATATGYENFINRHRALERSLRGRSATSDHRAFAEYVRMLTLWRRLPFFDPGLPKRLLPADWVGYEAARMFHKFHAELSDLAGRHVHDVITAATEGSRSSK